MGVRMTRYMWDGEGVLRRRPNGPMADALHSFASLAVGRVWPALWHSL